MLSERSERPKPQRVENKCPDFRGICFVSFAKMILTMEPSKPSPIIQHHDAPVDHCAFDSACALTPTTRLQIAGFAALAIAIVSVVMFGLYWLATHYL